jgi:hypothetical protein
MAAFSKNRLSTQGPFFQTCIKYKKQFFLYPLFFNPPLAPFCPPLASSIYLFLALLAIRLKGWNGWVGPGRWVGNVAEEGGGSMPREGPGGSGEGMWWRWVGGGRTKPMSINAYPIMPQFLKGRTNNRVACYRLTCAADKETHMDTSYGLLPAALPSPHLRLKSQMGPGLRICCLVGCPAILMPCM